jgi:CheY-like chemotaxis protein
MTERTAGHSRLTVLIVDDNRDVLDTLKLLLEMNGHAAYAAHDGLQAISLAEEIRPDVILLDIGLPKIDGYETCRRIRERDWGRRVMVYALTGLDHEDDLDKSKKTGFDMHLTKPVAPEVLLTVLAASPRASTRDPR